MQNTKSDGIVKEKFRPGAPKIVVGDHCSLLSEFDLRLFREGKHYMLYLHLGAHAVRFNGQHGMYFAVWAPNASQVSLIGDFNEWRKEEHLLSARWDNSGIWELFVPGLDHGTSYKYHIRHRSGYSVDKADPFGFYMENPPGTASVTSYSRFTWADSRWIKLRNSRDIRQQPLSIYEVHLGSWRRKAEENNNTFTYREMAEILPAYCQDMGFTHVELLPVMEHPFFGSWGYQLTGYYAPSSRFGSPDDFKFLINAFHKKNIGVILDWVPSHFPGDAHGLSYFDGSHLFEHADPKEGYHPDWTSYIFNYGRNEVKAFLISNAIFWLKEFHIDGLRVDAVASMLYRDYSRQEGEWIPNRHGGRENLEAITFLQELNLAVHQLCPGTFTVAEESTAWPGVTQEVGKNGLGFDFKWMMGWMHDSLEYFKTDPLYRSFHQQQLTFSLHYVFNERFVLPLSHDEVVHGKRSLLEKMPGDSWQKMANLRLLYAFQYGHPGAKLLFMGAELGQQGEWNHDESLEWDILKHPFHHGLQQLVRKLNQLYASETAWYDYGYEANGFEWIDFNDSKNSVICWKRKGKTSKDQLIFIGNFTPVVHYNYRVGIGEALDYTELLNTDAQCYGGSNVLNNNTVQWENEPWHQRAYSLQLTLPPLSMIILKPVSKQVLA